MIRIAGMPFEKSDIWGSGSIEHNIIQHMLDNPIVYSYQTLDELLFEVKMRKNIVESARAMNEGDSPFAIFEESRCNPQYWILTNAGGFRLRPGVKPSDAIRDIYKNSSLYAFECATAIMIIYYHAVLNSIDEYFFNQLFRDLYLYSWHADPDLGVHIINTRHFLPGDIVYFRNPDVNPETSWWRGENAVVLEGGTYFGHGIGIASAEQMIEELNQTRRPGSNRSAYLEHQVKRPAFNYLANYSISSRTYLTHKIQHLIVHHNESSISFARYLSYLNKAYNQIYGMDFMP